jgi:hypothetical protein
VLDRLAEEALSGLLHLANNESTDLGRRVLLSASLEPRVAVGVLDDLEGNVVEILLNLSVGELATDETLGSEEGVLRGKTTLMLRFREQNGTKRKAMNVPRS